MLRLLHALAAATVALAFAGCGASDPVEAEDVAAAAAKVTSAGTSRITVVTRADGLHQVDEGVVDYAHRRANLFSEMRLPPEVRQLGKTEIRFLGNVVYLQRGLGERGQVSQPAANLKPWLADAGDQSMTLDEVSYSFPFGEPARLLAVLGEVSGAVENLGEADIRGVSTDGYRVTVDLRRAIEEAPAKDRADLLVELAAQGKETQPIEVWIAEDGVARRLVMEDRGFTTTIDFYDFGVAVDVEAPPADQVESVDEHVPTSVEVEGPASGNLEDEPAKEDE